MSEINDTKLEQRLADSLYPIQIAKMAQELKDFKEEIHKKIDNGITSKLNTIYDKVMSLQCNVHTEKFNGFKDKFDSVDRRISQLFGAFIGVVVVGIILGIWVKIILAN